MLIFLDSNIICADYKMKSPSFEVAQKVGTIVLGQIVKERIEDGANEKAALRFPITALSFASISIFPG